MIWSFRRIVSPTALWIAVGHVGVVLLTFAVAMAQVPPAARADLPPTGKLRAGVNYGNFILAVQDAAAAGTWDIAFLGADPARAGEISFTAAYLEIEATYLVPAGAPLRTIADVDREGVRVAAPARAAYELFLSRGLKRAQLVRASNGDAAIELFTTGKVEALAGLRQGLIGLAAKHPGSRILDGQFFGVQQAVGVPKGREAGVQYLRGFVEEAKASGLVARGIERTGARGVSVAAQAPAQ